MKYQGLVLFLLISYSLSITFKYKSTTFEETQQLNISERGFRCPYSIGINAAIRLNDQNQVECISTDGKTCLEVKSKNKCSSSILQNIDKPKALCTTDLCKTYFYNRWICPSESGMKVAIMFSGDGHANCMSLSGTDCLYGDNAQLACNKVSTCKEFLSRIKPLKCGEAHQSIWGDNGYHSRFNHWCKKAIAFLKYTGDFLIPEATGVKCIARLTSKGGLKCKTVDGKACASNEADLKTLTKELNSGKTLECGVDVDFEDACCKGVWNKIVDQKSP